MRYPLKKVFITQEWNQEDTRENYARYGLDGHNGIDFRLFDTDGNRSTTAEVFAPHQGQVLETGWDADGYGYYLKIQNDKEGSILAHLKEFKVAVGDQVKEGDFVAIADNTGNSTGAHLHWGYYPIPRFRDNGFSGTINQLPLLEGEFEKEFCSTVKQVVTDILLGMKKTTSDDEINAWVERFVNPKQMTEEISTNDEAYRQMIAQPYLDEANKQCKQAVETAIKNEQEIWQSKLETAKELVEELSTRLKECRDTKCEDLSWKELIILGIKKFPN